MTTTGRLAEALYHAHTQAKQEQRPDYDYTADYYHLAWKVAPPETRRLYLRMASLLEGMMEEVS